MSAAVMAPRAPRRRTLERMGMTPEQELELLIREQEADDTHYVDVPGWQVSLDASAPSGEGGTIGDELIGRDPWELVDSAIDLGLNPAPLAYSGDLVDSMPPRRGLLVGGLIDPLNIPHATAGGYQNHKCRCVPCTAAWATYKRERRVARRAES
jgi:hypothetical protein